MQEHSTTNRLGKALERTEKLAEQRANAELRRCEGFTAQLLSPEELAQQRRDNYHRRGPKGTKDETVVHRLMPMVSNDGYHVNRRQNRRRHYAMWELFTVYERTNGNCGICGEKVSPFDVSIDHIIPLAAGGLDTISNMQLAHFACNCGKTRGYAKRKKD